MYLFDPIYWLVMGVTGALGMWASYRVKSTFARFSKEPTKRGVSGADVARQILEASGIYDVKVERVGGVLSDHYDPRNKTLRLSAKVYDGRTVAAAGVAAHEVGHALQHAKGYWPLQVRSYMAPAASFGSNLGLLIAIMGIAIASTGLAVVGILLFSVMVAFVLVTLPVEFDASKRAKALLPQLGFVTEHESAGVARVLNAAAMTYVASAVAAVAQLIYFILRSGILSSRD